MTAQPSSSVGIRRRRRCAAAAHRLRLRARHDCAPTPARGRRGACVPRASVGAARTGALLQKCDSLVTCRRAAAHAAAQLYSSTCSAGCAHASLRGECRSARVSWPQREHEFSGPPLHSARSATQAVSRAASGLPQQSGGTPRRAWHSSDATLCNTHTVRPL